MSNRTLIEINHDLAFMLKQEPAAFSLALYRYLCSASRDSAEPLERYGVKVVGMRHHSSQFVLDGTPEGFPPHYLPRAKTERA